MSNPNTKKILKQGKNSLLSIVFSRFAIIFVLMALQLAAIILLSKTIMESHPFLYTIANVTLAIVVIIIINVDMEPGAKLVWFLLIVSLPVFGTMLYLYTKYNYANNRAKRRIENIIKQRSEILKGNISIEPEKLNNDESLANIAYYLNKIGNFPIYNRTEVVYFADEEKKFEATLKALREAERFIFIESFIIEEGEMWGEVLEILKEKAKKGVKVRVIYDGTCEFFKLPANYPKKLEKYGIECRLFSKIVPLLSMTYNYRDHRKIVVIDNKTAFTGGSNFADEYINIKERFGHWKDGGVGIYGDAVTTYTLTFLEMWEVEAKEHSPASMINFRKSARYYTSYGVKSEKSSGYVLPFTDNPIDDARIGENVYLHLFYSAKKSLHICTPYLIMDYEMEQALRFAAEKGVDVKIVLPGIPDKKIPFAIAYTHYRNLLKSGVKIYEYTPGFIHSKTVVKDGKEGVSGTINLDYRSLYHHYENGVLLYGEKYAYPMEEDFEKIINVSKEITLENIKSEVRLYRKLLGPLSKITAPLM